MKTPLTLLYSPTSPYVRIVLVLIHEGGIAQHVSLQNISPWTEGNPVADITPTGTIPALVIADDANLSLLSDSSTICTYLIDRFGLTNLLPPTHKYQLLHLSDIANKISASLVARFLEYNKRSPEQQSSVFIERMQKALTNCVGYLEKHTQELESGVTIASITCACALGYSDLRYPEYDWRASAPKMAAWFEGFSGRLSMQMTKPPVS